MRRAVRRVTWILLSLALMTVLAFGLLSELFVRDQQLPRFFNPTPRNVRDLTHAAVERLRRGADPEAASELVRLGGAALPFVLPSFERFEPSTRERVALALVPVARRMGVAREDELSSGPRAIAFWVRFWQDRSVDFRVPVVRRLISRLSERSLALRREDVLALDTYALPELMKALGRVRSDEDVRRVRRLTTVLAHVAGQPLTLERDASVQESRRVVREWRAWWEANGADFVALDGPRRLAAMVRETSYGRWLSSVLRGELGRTKDGRTGLELVRAAAPPTLTRFALVLLLGTLLGAALSAWFSRTSTLASRVAGHGAAACAVLLMLVVASGVAASAWLASVLLTLALAALVVGHAPPASTSGETSKAAHAASLSLLAAELPLLASLLLAAESRIAARGLGTELAQALSRADLHAVMAVSLSAAFGAACVLVLGDAVHAFLFREPEVTDEP